MVTLLVRNHVACYDEWAVKCGPYDETRPLACHMLRSNVRFRGDKIDKMSNGGIAARARLRPKYRLVQW